MIHQLVDKFSLDNYSLVAITGGGGKTSLMYTLGNYFSCWEKVLATTTTHIRPPEAGACGAFFTGSIADCEAAAAKQQGPVLYAAARGYDGVKLAGYKQNEVDALSADGAFDRIFVEADGSQGLSFKVYEEWEPPVPASSSCQIVVAGADVLLSEASPLTIFRFYLLNKRYQIVKGEKLSCMNFASILSSRTEYLKNSPESAFRLLLLNKCELLPQEALTEIADRLPKLLCGYDAFAAVSLREDRIYAAEELSR